MPWYMWVAVWALGWAVAWRIGYSWKVGRELDRLDRQSQNRSKGRHYGGRRCNERYCCGKTKLDDHERTDYAVFSAIAAVFWPIMAIGFPAFLFATRPTPAERRMQQREIEYAELDALRKQAKELGLPFPDIDIKPLGETP